MKSRYEQIALRTSLALLVLGFACAVAFDWLLPRAPWSLAVVAKDLALVAIFGLLVHVGLRLQLRRAEADERRDLESVLQAREAELRTVFDCLDEGVVVCTTEGRFLLWNRAALEAYGLGPGSTSPGAPPLEDFTPTFRRDFEMTGLDGTPLAHPDRPLARILRGEPVRDLEVVVTRRSDGRRSVQSFGGALARDPQGKPLLAIVRIRDVTARHESQREIARLTDLNRALSGINEIIARVETREDLFEQACRIASSHASFRTVWIATYDKAERKLKVAARAGAASAYVHAIATYDEESLEGRGPAGRAVREGKACVVDDAREDPSMAPWREQAYRHALRSIAALPIRFHGEIFGAFVVYATEPGVFRDQELALLEKIVSNLSFALEHLSDEEKREHVELELAEEAVRRRVLMEQSRDGIVVLDSAGRVLETNFSFARMLGSATGSLEGRHLWELDRCFARDELLERLGGAAASPSGAPFETRLAREDGTLVDVEMSASPTELSAGRRLFYCVARDITSRKRQEEERRRAERHLATQAAVSRVLAEALSLQAVPRVLQTLCEAEGWEFGALWQVGPGPLDPAGPELRCTAVWHPPCPELDALEAQVRALGFARGAGLPGQTWQVGEASRVADVDAPGFLRARAAQEAGLRRAFAFPLRLKGEVSGVLEFFGRDAREVDQPLCDTMASVGGLVSQFLERQRAHDELTRFLSVSPTVLYALSVTPGLPLIWLSANPGDAQGGGAELRVGVPWLDRVHPDDRARVAAAHPLPYDTEHQVLEYRFRRRDGSCYWVRDEKRLLRDERGRPKEIVGSWADVSRQVELEAQVRQAQKMESLGQLAGGVAHDFNNIVAAIQGNAELLAGELPAAHPGHESLGHVLAACTRAKGLVQQILTFSRRQPGVRAEVDLGLLAEESRKLLRATLPAGVDLRSSVEPAPMVVRADPSQVHQVVLNLVTNSWHALEGRTGRVDLEVRPVTLGAADALRIPGAREGRYVRLTVRDDGVGMDAATLERVFDPFFTTKAPGKGTGLGMSVVHGIVQAHQGAIQVTSAPGRGATVDVYFAAVDARQARPAPAAPAPRGQGQHVLVVDDEPALVSVVERVLGRQGYQVTSFTAPPDALEAFQRAPQSFDLVVTDLNMPHFSGIDLAESLLRLRADLPVVLISGHLTDTLRAEAEMAGVRELLLKPFSAHELSQAVRRQLEPPFAG
ncbi:MAG: PAS domain S-box protein [Myxococcales bacterium]